MPSSTTDYKTLLRNARRGNRELDKENASLRKENKELKNQLKETKAKLEDAQNSIRIYKDKMFELQLKARELGCKGF